MRIYFFDSANNTAHAPDGELVTFPTAPTGCRVVEVSPGVAACRVDADAHDSVVWKRCFEAEALRALGVLQNQERMQFHPTSGEPLSYADSPTAGITEAGKQVFPRIDPSVIGVVELRKEGAEPRILLGRNAMRPGYFSLIAGYVDLGENFEQSFAREAMEEAGVRVSNITYVQSQAWPFSGSLMVGMHAFTTDEHPVAETDGELIETVWASRSDVARGLYNLPQEGSIALKMIMAWAHKHEQQEKDSPAW